MKPRCPLLSGLTAQPERRSPDKFRIRSTLFAAVAESVQLFAAGVSFRKRWGPRLKGLRLSLTRYLKSRRPAPTAGLRYSYTLLLLCFQLSRRRFLCGRREAL